MHDRESPSGRVSMHKSCSRWLTLSEKAALHNRESCVGTLLELTAAVRYDNEWRAKKLSQIRNGTFDFKCLSRVGLVLFETRAPSVEDGVDNECKTSFDERLGHICMDNGHIRTAPLSRSEIFKDIRSEILQHGRKLPAELQNVPDSKVPTVP